MIPLTFLYDEYIDRPKSSEQKKPFECLVPPPTSGVGTIVHAKELAQISFRKLSMPIFYLSYCIQIKQQ